MKPLVFVKLGGSLITDKEKPMTARLETIDAIAQSLQQFRQAHPEVSLVLGNGAGSFGHFQALHYGVHKGMKTDSERYGFAVVQDAVAQLNRLFVQSCLQNAMPVVSVAPSAVLVAEDGELFASWYDTIFNLIEQKLIPSMYGDIVLDSQRGSAIFSTETVFDLLQQAARVRKYPVQAMIFLSKTNGVYDANGKTIPAISGDTWPEQRTLINGVEGFDVTGGMGHKIERALSLAHEGVRTFITGDYSLENLEKGVFGTEGNGTYIA